MRDLTAPKTKAVALAAALLLALLFAPVAASASDIFAARFPGAELVKEGMIEYAESVLLTGELPKKFEIGPTETIEGRIQHALHLAPVDRSVLEVFRAYERAAVDAGFRETFGCRGLSGCGGAIPYFLVRSKQWLQIGFSDDYAYSLMERNVGGARQVLVLLSVTSGSSNPERAAPRVYLEVVSTDATETDVKILSSSEIAQQINDFGSAAIYGLEFALNSAELQPASTEVVRQIALYLEQNPGQKVYLVGHTDSQGDFAHNMDLSKRRAESVRSSLITEFNVAGNRLVAHGVGLLAPKASNGSPAGQARNRRVEVIPF